MIKIPIYRAKKIDSDEYIEGYLEEVKANVGSKRHFCIRTKLNMPQIRGYYNDGCVHLRDNYTTQIDPSTLAIHFPNMIDSEGTKIFASLSEDGNGGDICEFSHHKEVAFYANNRFFIGSGLEFFTVNELSKSIKVTGIKK